MLLVFLSYYYDAIWWHAVVFVGMRWSEVT